MTGIHPGLDPGGWGGDELVPLGRGCSTVLFTWRTVTGLDLAAHRASCRRTFARIRLRRRGEFSMPIGQLWTSNVGKALAPIVTSDYSGQGSAGIGFED